MHSSQALRRLGHSTVSIACRSWLPFSARGFAADASGVGDGPSVSGKDDDPIFGACVLQRLPLIRQPVTQSIQQQLVTSRKSALQRGELKDYPDLGDSVRGEAGIKQQQKQELRTFNPVPSVTAADKTGDISTMRRQLHESLYLVVWSAPGQQGGSSRAGGGDGGEWRFPVAVNTQEESISDTAKRALAATIGRTRPVFFVGNAPMAHVRARPKGTTFFLLAQAVDDPWGELQLGKDAQATEYAWLTKHELLSTYLTDARLRELVSKML